MKLLKTSIAAGLSYTLYSLSNNSKCKMHPSIQPAARNAICLLYPNGERQTYGIVSFQQESLEAETKVVATIKGLNPNSLHGLTLHEYGDLTEGI